MRERAVTAACLLLVLALPGQADWTSIGPEGGQIYSGAVTVGAAPELFVGSINTNFPLLRSTDRGASWFLTGGTLANYPQQLAAHPTNPDIMYGVASSQFYRTTNRGATWSAFSLGSNTNGNDIAINPHNPQVIYVPCYRWDGSAWRMVSAKSTNGGVNWTVTQLDTFASTTIYSAAVDPVDTNVVYMGCYAASMTSVYKSTDRGATWTKHDFPTNAYYVYSLLVDPSNRNVFAGTLYGVYRSTDLGQTWTRQSTNNYNYRLVFAPSDSNYMFSASYSYVYRSTDRGLTWHISSSGIQGTNIRTVLVDPTEPGAVYCGSTAGMFKSTNYGTSWQAVNNGIVIGRIPTLAVNPHEPATVWAEFADNDLFKTTDNGATWAPQSTPLSCGNICGIGFDPADPQRIWMLEGSG